jgi:hypothetical protein
MVRSFCLHSCSCITALMVTYTRGRNKLPDKKDASSVLSVTGKTDKQCFGNIDTPYCDTFSGPPV